jgi:hypothetical protein
MMRSQDDGPKFTVGGSEVANYYRNGFGQTLYTLPHASWLSTNKVNHFVQTQTRNVQRFGGSCCHRLQGEVSGAWIVIQDVVFGVITLCSDVVGYQRFGCSSCLQLQGEMSGAWIVIQVVVLWVIMQRKAVEGYQRFRGPCCLHSETGNLKHHRYKILKTRPTKLANQLKVLSG